MKGWIMAAWAATILAGCSSQPTYTISGRIEGSEGKVYLYDRDTAIDSAEVKNGRFRMKGTLQEPMLATFCDGDPMNAEWHIPVLLEAGTIEMTVGDENSLRGYTVKGTPANDGFRQFNERYDALVSAYRSEAATDEDRAQLDREYETLCDETIEANRDNIFGVLILQTSMADYPTAKTNELIARFSPEMQQTRAMQEIREFTEKKMLTEPGQPFIDLTQPTAGGEELSLASVVENPSNKYVLLDFWASWCGPCMAEVPALKEAYAAYHDKGFEIFGVSLDNDKERWTAAVEAQQMDWIHVSDLQGWQNSAAGAYGVRSIPANFLIDAQGRIVATNLRGEALKARIAELLD